LIVFRCIYHQRRLALKAYAGWLHKKCLWARWQMSAWSHVEKTCLWRVMFTGLI